MSTRPRRSKKAGASLELALPEVDLGAATPPTSHDTGFEFFPTPPEAIIPILESPFLPLPGGDWIEPCAGTGRIIRTVNAVRSDVRWLVNEIDERFDPHLRQVLRPGTDVLLPYGDFVHRVWPFKRAAVGIFNPPFSLSMAFILVMFDRADWVVMLQRNGWFSPKRASWLRQHCPDVYALNKRPSFTLDGATDNSEYSWFVWPPSQYGGRDRVRGFITMLDAPSGQVALPG